MSIYETLLNEIVQRLAGTPSEPANLATLGVDVKKLTQYKGAKEALKPSEKGRIYVCFAMHRFGTEKEPTNLLIGAPDQDSDLYVSVAIASRTLYDSGDGACMLDYLELVTRLLIGLKPSFGGEVSMFSNDLFEFDEANNTWHYQIMVRVRDLPVAPIDNFRDESPLDWPLLETLTFDEERDLVDIVTHQGENISVDGSDLAS